jgi:hypothetical protein
MSRFNVPIGVDRKIRVGFIAWQAGRKEVSPCCSTGATYRSFSTLSLSETPALKFGRSGFLRRAEAPYLFARAPMLRILPIVYRS